MIINPTVVGGGELENVTYTLNVSDTEKNYHWWLVYFAAKDNLIVPTRIDGDPLSSGAITWECPTAHIIMELLNSVVPPEAMRLLGERKIICLALHSKNLRIGHTPSLYRKIRKYL